MTATMTPALSDGVRALMAELANYEATGIGDVDHAQSSTDVQEYVRKLNVVHALWVAAETGTVPECCAAAVLAVVRQWRTYYTEEIARQRDRQQEFIVRGATDLHRADTIALRAADIESDERSLAACDEFLAAVSA